MKRKTKNDYDSKLAAIRAIGDNQIKKPHNIPVSIYIQEADTLYHWALEDVDALTGAGLSHELLEDLPLRCGALFEAESIWQVCRNTTPDDLQRWLDESPRAYELRNRLAADFRFAFRKHPDLLKNVTGITQNTDHATLIQQLNNLSVVGRHNTSLLEQIGFDMSLLELAAQTSDEMTSLKVSTNIVRDDDREEKTIRNQAYTLLKEAVDEIRDCGKYVFRNNKKRLSGYRSNYLRLGKNKKKASGGPPGGLPASKGARPLEPLL